MKYGLVGKTLAHSYSKEIHEALGKYEYDLFSLDESELASFIGAGDFGGLNVTIPYKKDVIPLCDEISDLARSIGAVNTLYWKPGDDTAIEASGGLSPSASEISAGTPSTTHGGRRLVGHNTDYEGFLYAAKRADITFDGKTVLILGTGGTSLMARKAAADQGAARIYIASRNAAPAETEISGKGGAKTLSSQLTYRELPAIADRIQVIVNTTPVGMYPSNMKCAIDLSKFPQCESVIDVVYNPFKTKLLLDAEKAGIRFSNGLPMLVAQATAAAGYFLGTPGAFESENQRIITAMERQMENLVLIGMPGSGKSTIGRLLARLTGKRFVDMDAEIEKRASMTIPEIFRQYGEKRFRDLESEAAADLGKERSLVISTGGGTVLRTENVDALRQNGRLIHVKRPVTNLPMDGRPLSKDMEALQRMEQKRLPIYEASADMTFDNSVNCSEDDLAARLASFIG